MRIMCPVRKGYKHDVTCSAGLTADRSAIYLRGDVKIPTYKPHTNHKKPSVSSHTLAPTTICDLSHSVCWSPLTDLGHISSVTYVCHPLWFVCGHRKGSLTSPLTMMSICNQGNLARNRTMGHTPSGGGGGGDSNIKMPLYVLSL